MKTLNEVVKEYRDKPRSNPMVTAVVLETILAFAAIRREGLRFSRPIVINQPVDDSILLRQEELKLFEAFMSECIVAIQTEHNIRMFCAISHFGEPDPHIHVTAWEVVAPDKEKVVFSLTINVRR